MKKFDMHLSTTSEKCHRTTFKSCEMKKTSYSSERSHIVFRRKLDAVKTAGCYVAYLEFSRMEIFGPARIYRLGLL